MSCNGRHNGVKLWIFDLDNTLYQASEAVFPAIRLKMKQFIAERLGVDLVEARRLQVEYLRRYGTTFLGLKMAHGIAPADFFTATHDFAFEGDLKSRFRVGDLQRFFRNLPGRRVVLTNAPRCYAHRVLRHYRFDTLFESVICAEDMRLFGQWRSKPDPAVFIRTAAQFRVHPSECVFIDDSLKNLRAAKSVGMKTLWCVGYVALEKRIRPVSKPSYVDAVIHDISELSKWL